MAHNQMGVNGYRVKWYPPEDVLHEALHQLNSEFQLTVKLGQGFDSIYAIRLTLPYFWQKSWLHELNKQFDVPTVLEKVANDVNQANRHHADGFAKLNAQALQMGGVGLDIYGIKDQWSSFLLHLVIVPNHWLVVTIGHVHLNYITKYMAIPPTFVTDRGSETGIIFANQTVLHMVFAPNVDANQCLPFQFLNSVHNTPIKGLWHWFLDTKGINVKILLQSGLHDGVYHPNKSLHKQLFYWLWPKILQASQGGQDCKIPVTQDVIDALRHEIPVSRDVSMCWVSEEFGNLAERIYKEIGCPNFMLHGGWAIFQQMEEILVDELQVDELL
ncbi:hypothetical protein BKA82DRAFT_4332055 [Pisolithus tinctorius]|nr:hypothetical protein BKA82DRAFT_4332055 [Pisolithus tinctorius]